MLVGLIKVEINNFAILFVECIFLVTYVFFYHLFQVHVLVKRKDILSNIFL